MSFDKSATIKEAYQNIWQWLLVIFLVALAYRTFYFLEVRHHPLFMNPVVDADQHHAWAQRISAGAILGRGAEEVFKPWLYPLFLGGAYYLSGPNVTAIQWLHFILGSVSAALTALLGTVLFGKRVGIVAGFLGALYAPFLFFEGQLLTPALSIFFNLILALMLVTSSPPWGMIGLLGGVAAGVRPDILISFPMVCGYRLWGFAKTHGNRKALAKLALLVSGFMLVCIPITARNYRLSGQFVLFSANAGINFYTGNGPDADGVSAIPTGLAWEKAISTVPKEMLSKPASTSRLWFSRGLQTIAEDPVAWLGLLGKKFLAFFNGSEFRNNIGYGLFREGVFCLKFPFIQYWPIAALAILGMGLCFLKPYRLRERNLLLLWITGYFIVGLMFFVTARFRLPTLPFMIILASWALCWLYRTSTGGFKQVLRSAVLVVLLLSFTWPGWFDPAKRSNNRDYINLGNVFRKNGKPQEAISAYEKASEVNPQDPDGWLLAGTTYLHLNQPARAIEHLERAFRLCPTGADIILNLGSAYQAIGKTHQAENHYRDLIELNSKINLNHKRGAVALAHLGLWRIYRRQQRLGEAQIQMEDAWQVDERTAAEFCTIQEIKLKKCAEVFERVAREEPWNWYPRANLGIAYFKMGRFDRAAEELSKSSALKGVRPGVKFYLALALIRSGRKAEAEQVLSNLSEELPQSPLRNRVQEVLQSLK
jgi:tetratricopeptide (TPR) repeat protein